MTPNIFQDLSGDEKQDPIAFVRRDSRPALPRRFYTKAEVMPRDGKFVILLDGKLVRTPGREVLALPTQSAALAVCAEWSAQGDTIDPASMPMTRLVNSAIDGVAREIAAVKAEIVKYAASDLLCYRAGEPEKLVRQQADSWDPILQWADVTFGARFYLSQGIVFVEQPAAAVEAIGRAVSALSSPLALACLHVMTTLTGSALLGLAVAHGRLSAAEAWTAANIDEDFEMQAWGFDDEALERRAKRWREMEAASQLLRLIAVD